MATYWENSCSFGLRYVSWYKYLIVSLVFSHLGFWSWNLFLIAPFPDLCLLVPLDVNDNVSGVRQFRVPIDLCCQTKSACVGLVCNIGSLELYNIQKGSLTGMQYGYGPLGIIVHPFAGALVDNYQLRRARGVRGFVGRKQVRR